MPVTYRITKAGIKKRSTPSTIVRKAQVKKMNEAIQGKTDEEKAEILAQLAQKALPRGPPSWTIPVTPPNLPAVQAPKKEWSPYQYQLANLGARALGELTKSGAEWAARKAGLTQKIKVKNDAGQWEEREILSSWVSAISPYLGQATNIGAQWGTQYYMNPSMGYNPYVYGFGLLEQNHQAHYRPINPSNVGTPLRPVHKSLEMVNAY